MESKIKVVNPHRNRVYVNLVRLNGKEFPVNGNGGFILLSEDEVAFLQNSSKVFDNGSLKIVNADEFMQNLGVVNSPNAITDEEIVKMLRKTQKQIEASLGEIDNLEVMQRVLEIAKTEDKSIKVIEAIENKIQSLME